MSQLLMASRKCDQCLTTPNRIVSGTRAAQIILECRRTQTHFFCHKGSLADQQIHCRGVHEIVESKAYQLATRLGIPVVQVEPESLQEKRT